MPRVAGKPSDAPRATCASKPSGFRCRQDIGLPLAMLRRRRASATPSSLKGCWNRASAPRRSDGYAPDRQQILCLASFLDPLALVAPLRTRPRTRAPIYLPRSAGRPQSGFIPRGLARSASSASAPHGSRPVTVGHAPHRTRAFFHASSLSPFRKSRVGWTSPSHMRLSTSPLSPRGAPRGRVPLGYHFLYPFSFVFVS